MLGKEERREEHNSPAWTGLTTAELPPYYAADGIILALAYHKHHSNLSDSQ